MSWSTTTSQSATQTPYNVTPPVWTTYSVPSAPVSINGDSSEYHATNSGNNVNNVNNVDTVNNVSILSNQVVYNPPNYINIPYQTNTGSNTGYTTSIPSGGINPQITNGPNFQRTQNGHIIGGQAWPNQSALGRFISQSPGWTSNKTTGGVKKQKRIRTAFTSQQMMELEQEYSKTRYLDRARRIELQDTLRLNERTIKIWFQNRRMKEKKDRAESLEDCKELRTSESSPEIGDAQMPMRINEQYSGMENNVYNQSEVYCQGNIYVENYPATSTPIQMSMTSLPLSMPAASLPASMPATNLPHMMPATNLPLSMSATSLPTSMPMMGLPPSMPGQTSVQNMYQTYMMEEHVSYED